MICTTPGIRNYSPSAVTQQVLARYNATPDDDHQFRTALLRDFLSAIGEGTVVLPSFACDYGYNIRLGRNVFINYHCIFLDCAPIGSGSV